MKKPKIKSIGYGFYCILMIIISVLGFILYNLGNWVLDTWGLLSIDEIIFHLKVPLDGTNSDVVLDGDQCMRTIGSISIIFIYFPDYRIKE